MGPWGWLASPLVPMRIELGTAFPVSLLCLLSGERLLFVSRQLTRSEVVNPACWTSRSHWSQQQLREHSCIYSSVDVQLLQRAAVVDPEGTLVPLPAFPPRHRELCCCLHLSPGPWAHLGSTRLPFMEPSKRMFSLRKSTRLDSKQVLTSMQHCSFI